MKKRKSPHNEITIDRILHLLIYVTWFLLLLFCLLIFKCTSHASGNQSTTYFPMGQNDNNIIIYTSQVLLRIKWNNLYTISDHGVCHKWILYMINTTSPMLGTSLFPSGPEMITPSDFTAIDMLTTTTGLECEVWLSDIFSYLSFPDCVY